MFAIGPASVVPATVHGEVSGSVTGDPAAVSTGAEREIGTPVGGSVTATRVSEEEVQFLAALGALLRERRREVRASLDGLATRIGKTASYVCRLEKAERPGGLRMWQYLEICRALDVDPVNMFARAYREAFPLILGGDREREGFSSVGLLGGNNDKNKSGSGGGSKGRGQPRRTGSARITKAEEAHAAGRISYNRLVQQGSKGLREESVNCKHTNTTTDPSNGKTYCNDCTDEVK